MPLNKHIETVQLSEAELRIVQDDTQAKVQVFHSEKPDPIAVFGYGSPHDSAMNEKEARIRGVEYANGYARAKGGDD